MGKKREPRPKGDHPGSQHEPQRPPALGKVLLATLVRRIAGRIDLHQGSTSFSFRRRPRAFMGKRFLTEGKQRYESEENGRCCSSAASLASASWRTVRHPELKSGHCTSGHCPSGQLSQPGF